MPKVLLERVVVVNDEDGNSKGFGPGEADVPDELMEQVEASARRRGFEVAKIAEADGIEKFGIEGSLDSGGSITNALIGGEPLRDRPADLPPLLPDDGLPAVLGVSDAAIKKKAVNGA